MMTIDPCKLGVKDGLQDWCLSGCNRYHHGHHRPFALGEDEKSEAYRWRWRQLAANIEFDPEPERVKTIPYTAAQMVAEYAETLARHIAGGRKKVPLRVWRKRRDRCNSCDHRDKDLDACKICRCSLSPSELMATVVGDKLKWAVTRCPIDRWHEWHDEKIIHGTVTGKHGVVIGSYGMPGVVELSIAMIRKTCGEVPILIADDCTPASMGKQRLLDMPAKWPGVSLRMSGENLGHAPGDVRAFRNGLLWAKANGIDYICKLSQRFIFLTDNWLHDWCDEMKKEKAAVSSQRAVHLHMAFAMRSECVFMDVARCTSSPGMMARLDPEGGKIAASAEDWISAAVNEGGLGPIMRCRQIPVDRFAKREAILWHNTDGADIYGEGDGGGAYREWARKLGIDLGQEFSAAGWHVIAPNRPDANYHML